MFYQNILAVAQGVAALGILWIVIAIVAGLLLAAFLYAAACYPLMLVGRKAGLRSDWMPFVPIANTIYFLRIVDYPWWYLFFSLDSGLGFTSLAALIVFLPFAFSSSTIVFGLFVASVVLIAGLVFTAINSVKIYREFYKRFDFDAMLGFIVLVPGVAQLVMSVFMYLIAFSNKFDYVGPGGAGRSGGFRDGAPAPNSSVGLITGISGMYAGQNFEIKNGEELIFGRDGAYAHIIIDKNAAKVSRKHCAIRYDAASQSYYVTDYSSNGTYQHGGARLIANIPTSLPTGTFLSLGDNSNQFKLGY